MYIYIYTNIYIYIYVCMYICVYSSIPPEGWTLDSPLPSEGGTT